MCFGTTSVTNAMNVFVKIHDAVCCASLTEAAPRFLYAAVHGYRMLKSTQRVIFLSFAADMKSKAKLPMLIIAEQKFMESENLGLSLCMRASSFTMNDMISPQLSPSLRVSS